MMTYVEFRTCSPAAFTGAHGKLETCGQTAGRRSTYVEVLCVDLAVLGKIEVFLGHEYTLTKEVLVDLLAVGFWDKPEALSQPRNFFDLEMQR